MNQTGAAIAERAEMAFETEVEAELARIWCTLIQRESIDRDDDYFALGGNSLGLANLFARIEAQFGVRLPLSSILEAPTVAQLARVIESRGSHHPVVLIRDGAGKPPVFLFHDADGETMLYRGLAERLDPGHPVYGLKPFSRPGYPMLHTRIEEMAAFHVRNILAVEPTGPYLLGGLCAGGLIAFEVARQLEREGRHVVMVALMDVADVEAEERPARFAAERLASFASSFDGTRGGSRRERLVRSAAKALRKVRGFAGYQVTSRAGRVRDEIVVRLFRWHQWLGVGLPPYVRGIPVRTLYNEAKRAYRPATPYRGEMLLLRATGGTGGDASHAARHDDPHMGWGRRTTAGVRSLDVPGGHSSMLQEPNVGVLAEHLQAYVDDSLRAYEAARSRPGSSEATVSDPVETTATEMLAADRPFHIVPVSAADRDGLGHEAARLAESIESDQDADLAELERSLVLGRAHRAWRRAATGATRTELAERLRKGSGRGAWTAASPAVSRGVGFILAGVGEQGSGVGRELYESEPAFRRAVDDCAHVLQPILGRDIRPLMFEAPAPRAGDWLRGGGAGVLRETQVAQPAAFVLDWALAQLWMSWGIRPSAVLGYSVGEYVAAALAGVLRMEDSLEMLARRAAWIDELAEPGGMLAVPAAESEIQPYLADGLWIAAANSPQASVVGGREEAIRGLEERLAAAGMVARRVISMNGTHTPLLDPVRAPFGRFVAGIRRETPRVPMLSNVTGRWLTDQEARDPDYWCRQMCSTLRFEAGAGELLRFGDLILLEIGPGAGLGAMIRQHAACGRDRMGRVLASLPAAWDRISEREHVASTLGRLWAEGAAVDWRAYLDLRPTMRESDSPGRREVPQLADSH